MEPKDLIVPPALSRGSRVVVVAPSGPFDDEELLAGVRWLEERYEVTFDPGLFEKQGYLAGSDERRLLELNRALRDRRHAAVFAARGGYGLHRVAPAVDFAALRAAPKWLVGFSDATVLHEGAWQNGVASLHAANVTGLGRAAAPDRERLRQALEAPLAFRRFPGLECWSRGRASGPLAGGNLTVLFASAAAGRLRFPEGAIVVLEDVTEQAYRVDRMLSTLSVAGAFDRVSAVVVGEFTDCPPSQGVSASDVARERLARLGVPVAAGLPIGHGARNDPLCFGPVATLDANRGVLELGEARDEQTRR